MQVLAINCPECGEKLLQITEVPYFEAAEDGFIYGCETLDCPAGLFRFHSIPPEEESKYALWVD